MYKIINSLFKMLLILVFVSFGLSKTYGEESDSEGKGFSAKLWSIDLTGYNERLVKTETDGSDPSWSSLLSK